MFVAAEVVLSADENQVERCNISHFGTFNNDRFFYGRVKKSVIFEARNCTRVCAQDPRYGLWSMKLD